MRKRIKATSLVLAAVLIIASVFSVSLSTASAAGQADLIVTEIVTTPSTPNAGEEVSFAVKVKNVGDIALPTAKIPVHVLVGGKSVAYNDSLQSNLAVNQEITIPLSSGPQNGKWTATENEVTLEAEVNYQNTIPENSLTNNSLTKTLTPIKTYDSMLADNTKSDLVVTAITSKITTVYDGDYVTLVATVRNSGTEASPAMVDVTFAADNKIIDTVTLKKSIEPDGMALVSTEFQWRANFGMHKYYAVINSTRVITERNYNNNVYKTRTIIIDDDNPNPTQPKTDFEEIDLTVSDVYTDPLEYQIGEPVKLVAVVKNQGKDTTNGIYRVKFTIDNQTFYSDYQTALISPNGEAVVTSSEGWIATAGKKSIAAEVNDSGTVYEKVTNNNTKTNTGFESMRGARVPFITYEAEDGTIKGEKLTTTDRLAGEIAGEASGRSAVRLTNVGDYVEWTAKEDANSIVMRATMPDIGLEDTRTISVYLNNKKIDTMTMTTKYSWVYGNIASPQKDPSLGGGFHIYDDTRVLLKETIKAGDKIKIQKDSTDTATYYGIDFVDLELVGPAIKQPDGFVSLTDYGATNGGTNAAEAMSKAISDAISKGKKGVYIPEGNWGWGSKISLPGGINDNATGDNRFQIMGAGMWYTRLYATSYGTNDWGNFGFNCRGKTVYYHDFMMDGMNKIRTEGGKPFANGYGKNTTMENLWIEHTTCGFWNGGVRANFGSGTSTASMQSNGLLIKDCRIRNTGADGINLCNATSFATVQNVECRSNGDDAFAIWSAQTDTPATEINPNGCEGNVIKNCTAKFPWRANCYGVYGGKDNTIRDSIAVDTLTYMGIYSVENLYGNIAFSGTLTLERMDLIRVGGIFWDGRAFPAIEFSSANENGKIIVKDVNVTDTLYTGIHLSGKNHVDFENVTVDGYARYNAKTPANSNQICALFVNNMTGSYYNFKNVNFYNPGPKTRGFFGSSSLNTSLVNIQDCNWNTNGLK